MFFSLPATATPLRVVALGDSLTAGYGLKPNEDYASQLQTALKAAGYDVTVENRGISGDTAAGGAARLDTALKGEAKPALVLIELGANDMLRGQDPVQTAASLRGILQKLQDRKIPAYLMGMKAAFQMGPAYRKKFDSIYPDLADEFDVPLYPFFLEGVILNPNMTLSDGLHPTRGGVALVVEKTLPGIKKQLDKTRN